MYRRPGEGARVNVNIELKDLPAQEGLRKLIERLSGKLERKLARLASDGTFVRVMLEENTSRRLYRAAINLELRKKVLVSRKERHDAGETLRGAFADIERQIETYKATVRHEKQWKRRARPSMLGKIK
jgi:ribosome-associated translation inhibitor RaiA